MNSFVLDTSAFLSLESISLLSVILNNFSVVTSKSVIDELEAFAIHNDSLGEIAQRVLKQKFLFQIEIVSSSYSLPFVSQTDADIFTLACSKQILLISDDIKLLRHISSRTETAFSTFFLLLFTEAGLYSSSQASELLEKLRVKRNWQNNIIYLSTKKELEA